MYGDRTLPMGGSRVSNRGRILPSDLNDTTVSGDAFRRSRADLDDTVVVRRRQYPRNPYINNNSMEESGWGDHYRDGPEWPGQPDSSVDQWWRNRQQNQSSIYESRAVDFNDSNYSGSRASSNIRSSQSRYPSDMIESSVRQITFDNGSGSRASSNNSSFSFGNKNSNIGGTASASGQNNTLAMTIATLPAYWVRQNGIFVLKKWLPNLPKQYTNSLSRISDYSSIGSNSRASTASWGGFQNSSAYY